MNDKNPDTPPLREFKADLLPDGRFGEVKVLLFRDRVVVEYGGFKSTYLIKDLSDVRLVEGFGINWIVARYNGSDVTLVNFTNRHKEEMNVFIGILSSLISGVSSDVNNNKVINYVNGGNIDGRYRSRVIKWLLDIIKPYRFRIALA